MQRTGKLIAVIFTLSPEPASELEEASAQNVHDPAGYQFFVTPICGSWRFTQP